MTQTVTDSKSENLGDRIRIARKEAQPRVTIAAIARELNVDPRTVARWQANESTPSVANLQRLAALLGRNPGYFLDGISA